MASQPVMDFRLKLEIELKDSKNGIIIEDEYGNPNSGLDIDFEIVKSYEPTPQASTITIYNISTDTYNLIYEKADAFRLSCARGKDQDYTPFYVGYPIRATKVSKDTILTSNQGFMAQDANAGRRGQNDLETTITLMNFGFARLYKSYRTAVSSEIVINDCIEAFGLPKGNMDTFEHVMLPAGYSIRGDVAKALDNLGNRLGFYWNVNDMKFNIYDRQRSQFKTYGITLNGDNSGTPERQDDVFKGRTKTIQKASKKKGIKGVKAKWVEVQRQGFKITTQLLPFLQCGSTCYCDFDMADVKGEKYIYKIVHKGSNTGTECSTDVYCL